MPGWNADLTTGAVQSVAAIDGGLGGAVEAAAVVCDEWVDHPVLLVQRDTFANFFHDRLFPPSCVCFSSEDYFVLVT